VDADSEAAFEAYVAARRRALLKSAWLLTGDWHRAEDLVQEALAKTYLKWRRMDEPDAYVRRVLVTTYVTWWRRRWRGEQPAETLPEQAAAGPDVDLRHQLYAALRTLPRRQRAVVVLRYFEDRTEAETAAALGCSVGTVKSQHARAMARLRDSAGLADLAPANGGADR
jgi:RNA polymerase sigma-70 factor (sigma-E family)